MSQIFFCQVHVTLILVSAYVILTCCDTGTKQASITNESELIETIQHIQMTIQDRMDK